MDLPLDQRRFVLSPSGTITLHGRFDNIKKVTSRIATPDDLAVMSWFDEKVLHNEGSVDVSTMRWTVFRALKVLNERQAAAAACR